MRVCVCVCVLSLHRKGGALLNSTFWGLYVYANLLSSVLLACCKEWASFIWSSPICPCYAFALGTQGEDGEGSRSAVGEGGRGSSEDPLPTFPSLPDLRAYPGVLGCHTPEAAGRSFWWGPGAHLL